MRDVPAIMRARWQSGEYIGDAKPIARITIHRPNIQQFRTVNNLFTSLMFGGGGVPREITNVKSVTWTRDTDVDVATCTIELYNTEPLPLGAQVTRDLDQPGYFTYNRGSNLVYAQYWGHAVNEWSGMLMPDNIIRTFEGYGFDPNVTPDFDENLVQTGIWMIDDVSYGSDGTISVQCRDTGRMLLDQIAFPPVVPFTAGFIDETPPPHGPIYPDGAYAYPVSFTGAHTRPPSGANPEPIFNNTPVSSQRLALSPNNSSNTPYTSGAVYGHRVADAFDDEDSTFWLSIGNARPDQGYSFEWVQGALANQRVRRVRFKSWKGGHTAYLCIFADGEWKGANTVPYNPSHPASAPNGSNTKYVAAASVTGTGWTEFNLPGEGIENVTRVRITFGNLQHSGLGEFPYRAGVRRLEAFGIGGSGGGGGGSGGSGAITAPQAAVILDQNYEDYVDIVKLFCAWGGFYWPRNVVHMVGDVPGDLEYMGSAELVRARLVEIRENRELPEDYDEDSIWVQRIFVDETHTIGDARTAYDFLASERGAEEILSGGFKRYWGYAQDDPSITIEVGRVWGDFQFSGTAGPALIPHSVFEKKPLMDGIAYVRDILGFLFFVDELGGVVFKAPNIYRVGNMHRTMSTRSGQITTDMLTIDERVTLMGLTANVTGRNLRERTFVSNGTGEVGHMAQGWNPNPIGLRRVGGWTDQHFETSEECLVMAEMIGLRQLFSYRSNDVQISGFPGIQIDDQCRILEAVTSEGFIHYIKGIRSTLDHESGVYTYDLTTHWLGERPFERWVFDPEQLSDETQEYLRGLYGVE